MSESIQRLKVLSAGIMSLVLMLGIARFAYTPLLPLMREQAGLGLAEGGWLAAINYMGYLSGALIAASISDLLLKDRLYRIGLVVALLTTIGMGVTENLWLWALFRYFAGLSSAAGLLLGSGLILHWLIRHGHRSELGIHFSGLGIGIALCAAAVEWMDPCFDWSEQWRLFTAIGLLLAIPAWRWLPPPDHHSPVGAAMEDAPPGPLFLRIFMAVYFCAGFGYVVSATFIVAIVDQLPGLEGRGGWSFLVIGLAAAPACIVWDLIARRTGDLNALTAAFVLQIIGILLPVLHPTLTGTLIGAALFGATFIGIVSLVLTMAGRYYPSRPAKMMGRMTVTYGVAQILAPALTGQLAELYGGYGAGLYVAAGVMGVGVVLLVPLRAIEESGR